MPLKNANAFVVFTGLDPSRTIRDSIAANDASPTAANPNCGDCSTLQPCQLLKRKHGGHFMSTIGKGPIQYSGYRYPGSVHRSNRLVDVYYKTEFDPGRLTMGLT
jgi:hypothetical protein